MVLYTCSFLLFHKLTSFTFSPPALHGPCHMKTTPSVLTARFHSQLSVLILTCFCFRLVAQLCQKTPRSSPFSVPSLLPPWCRPSLSRAEPVRSCEALLDHAVPRLRTLQWLDDALRVKARILFQGVQDQADLLPSWPLWPPLSFFSLFPLLQMHWLSCCFSEFQGWSHLRVYICCSLCLKCSSSKPQSSLPHIFPVLPKYNPLSGVFPGQPL